MEIRLATIQDTQQILELWKAQYVLHNGLDPIYFLPWDAALEEKVTRYVRKGVETQDPFIFVAVDDTGVIGFASCREEEDTYIDTHVTRYGFIYELFVAESARQQGVGGKLLKAVEEHFAAQGVKYLKLFASEFNKSALDFYPRVGFVPHFQMFLKQI